jgi:signal transduction histidine kinase
LFRISPAGVPEAELLKSSVFALHRAADGTLWAGTDRGLMRFANGRFSPVTLPSGTLLRQIVSIASDSHGALWLCDQEQGLFRWKDRDLTAFSPRAQVSRRTAYGVFVGRDDRIWVALSGGMLGLIGPEQRMELFGPSGDGSLRVVVEGQNNILWIGGDDGLSRFGNGRFVTASRRNGLPGSAVAAVVEDAEGYIWAGVGSAIIQVNPTEFDELAVNPSHQIRYKIYDRSDGLAGDAEWFATPSSVRADDGRLWFVTAGGVSVVDPSALKANRLEPRAQISGVIADQHIFDPTQPVTMLRPFTQRLEIEYAAVNFVSPTKVRFRYRLDGFDKEWIDAGTRRQAFYTNLAPRAYRFRVAAVTSEGTWNESGAKWDFSIEPAFYQTRWFYACAMIMILPLVWAGWRLRLRQVQRQFSLVLAERARMSRELHDTLLQSLVGVALQFEGLSHRVDVASPSLKEHLLRIRMQVEEYIREARESILELRSPRLEPRDLAAALREAGERITTGKPVRFQFETDGTPHRCRQSVEEQLLRIGREALYNAVRHARATHIRVQLRYDRRSLRLRVTDDGIGFDGERLEGHYGLANMQDRAKQIGGRFKIATDIGKGTEIDTVVPIS